MIFIFRNVGTNGVDAEWKKKINKKNKNIKKKCITIFDDEKIYFTLGRFIGSILSKDSIVRVIKIIFFFRNKNRIQRKEHVAYTYMHICIVVIFIFNRA